jgi:hypothetical protein
LIPLLVGGLERAMRLSESMVSRGFGATSSTGQGRADRLGILVGLAAAFAGWLVALMGSQLGWLLVLGGATVVVVVLWRRGRHARRTNYLPSRWHFGDVLLMVTAVVAILIVMPPWPFLDQSSLSYSTYPQLQLPAVDWLMALVLAAMAIPALLPSFSLFNASRNGHV